MPKQYKGNKPTKSLSSATVALDLILTGVDPAEAARIAAMPQALPAGEPGLSNRERVRDALDDILANIILPNLSIKLGDILDQILEEAMRTNVEEKGDA